MFRASTLPALLLLASAGCSLTCGPAAVDDGGIPDAGETADAGGLVRVEATFGPAGGRLVHPAGAILELPAGALAAQTVISIEALGDDGPARGFGWVGGRFRFGPAGQTFGQSVKVTLPWSAAELGARIAAHVAVYAAPDGTAGWRPLPSVVDDAARSVTAQLSHFTAAGPGVPFDLAFTPHDLAFEAGAVWLVGDRPGASPGPGGALYRLDPLSGSVATWQGAGGGWTDAWGIALEGPGQARVTAWPSAAPWEVLAVGLSVPEQPPVVAYTAPFSGVATTLHGLATNARGTWSGFQSCTYLHQTLASAQADATSIAGCERTGVTCSGPSSCGASEDCLNGDCVPQSAPPVMLGGGVARLDPCQFASSPGREFGTRFGAPCSTLVDLAPASGAPNDVVATDAHQRVIYLSAGSDLLHSTVIGIAGFNDTPGFRDGPAYSPDSSLRALFDGPAGVVVASDGTIYVADTNNHAVRRITPVGSLVWGEVCTVYGGPSSPALRSPQSVALDQNEAGLWVSDSAHTRVVYVPLAAALTPSFSAVAPTTIAGGAADTTLTIDGTGFDLDATVLASGQPLATAWVSAGRLTAVVPAALLASATTLQVSVRNGCSTASGALPVAVTNPVPTLASVTPLEIQTGSPTVTLTFTGTGLEASGTVFFGADALVTTVQSASAATALVPATLIAADRFVPVTFVNPAPGGGTSNALSVAVLAWREGGGTPQLFAGPLPAQPTDLAIANGVVYWTQACSSLSVADGTVHAQPVDGGPAVTLASAEFCPEAIAVTAGEVYWATAYGDVKVLPLDGGAATLFGHEQFGQPSDLAIDSNGVFVLNGNLSGSLVRFPPGSSNAQMVANLLTSPRRFVLGFSGAAVWTASDAVLRLANETQGTTIGQSLGAGPAGTTGWGIALDPSAPRVFWTALRAQNGAVLSYDGQLRTIATGQRGPSGVATDGTAVYWLNSTSGFEGVIKSSPDGGIPTRLTSQTSLPSEIALDSTTVYWVDNVPGSGSAYRILSIGK